MMLKAIGTVLAAAFALQAPPQIFDSVSIKPDPEGQGLGAYQLQPGGRFSGSFTTRALIALAFSTRERPLRAVQVVEGPDWTVTSHFTINARAPETITLVAPYIRAMLVDRFKLAAHWDVRDIPVYAVTLARKDGQPGPHLRPSQIPSQAVCTARAQDPSIQPHCGLRNNPRGFTAVGVPITLLFAFLAPTPFDRPLVDSTGLTGLFDAELQQDANTDRLSGDAMADALAAVEEQLGLKLEPRRDRMDVVVVDHIERPTPD